MLKDISEIPCFLINQEHQVNRLKHMIKLLEDIGFKNIIVIRPFNADIETKNKLQNKLGRNVSLSLSQSSHFLTYLTILENNMFDNILILEDDIIPTYDLEDIKKMIHFSINNHPKDTEMLYFEFCSEKCNDFTQDFIELNRPVCAASIYYPSYQHRKNIVKKIKNYKPSLFVRGDQTDIVLANLINKKKIKAYTHRPIFAQDHTFGSNIEGSSKNPHTTCINNPKGLENRKIKNDIGSKNYWLVFFLIITVLFTLYIILFRKKSSK